VQEEISLNDYIGSNVLIRFVLVSDGFLEFDGFYFDDFNVSKILPGTNAISEPLEASAPTLMPNPASNYVLISCAPINSESMISVTDITGKIVLEIPCNAQQSTIRIETEDLNAGVYHVRIHQKGASSKPAKLVVY